MERSANRPILVQRINLWWYVLALVVILALAWATLSSLLPSALLPLILFAIVFWVMSFVMAVIAKLRAPRTDKTVPESRT